MRSIIAIVLAITVSGCVRPAPRLPAAQGPTGSGSTDWRALASLPHGRFIMVMVDGGEMRASSLWSVNDTAVTLWYDFGSYVVPRASVTHVVSRVQIGEKQVVPWYEILLGSAAGIGGLVVAAWGADHKNKTVTNIGKDVAGGAGLALLLTAAGMDAKYKPVYEDRLVYIRP